MRRSDGKGGWLACCWDDCTRPGDTRYQVGIPREPQDAGEAVYLAANPHINPRTIYLFCCERHRALFRHSHVDNGNLPTGSRGMLT